MFSIKARNSNDHQAFDNAANILSDEDLDQVSGGWVVTVKLEHGTMTYFNHNNGDIGMIYRDNNRAIPAVHFVNGFLVHR